MEFLPGDSGALLIGTSANAILLVLLSELIAQDCEAEVLLESHTGNLRALATLTSASLCFCVGLNLLNQDQAIVAQKIDAGHDVKQVALKMIPELGTTERALQFLQQGRLVVTRYNVDDKIWLTFDPFGRGGGEFVEQAGEETLFLWQATKGTEEEMQAEEGANSVTANLSLKVIEAEGKMTQGRAKVTISRKMACLVQKNLKPNQRFASRIGDYLVDVRAIEYETDPLSLPKGASRKQILKMHKNVSVADRERSMVAKGDIFTYVGGFDIPLQSKVRRAVSRLVHVPVTCITVQRVVFKQEMPVPDPKSKMILSLPDCIYQVMMRVNVPSEREQAVSDTIYKALGARKVSPWVRVRTLIRNGSFKLEAAGRRVKHRQRSKDEMNDFEVALDKQGVSCTARPVSESRWQHEREPRTMYLTCGDDSILRGWDAMERRCVVKRDLGYNRVHGCLRRVRRRALCIVVSPIGPEADQWVAIGYKGGTVSIHHVQALAAPPLIEISDRQQDITNLKFAPSGSILAVASAERTIDLYAKWYVPNDPDSHNYDPSANNFVMQVQILKASGFL